MKDMGGVMNLVQDRWIDWREEQNRKNDQRQQQADVRRARMTCAAGLPTFQQTQDWMGNAALSPSGRFQVIEEKKPAVPLISRDGIRWHAALTILILTAVILTAVLLADLAGMGTTGRMLGKLDAKIAAVENRNRELQEELSVSSGSLVVCTEAVKMNLISSNGARTIRLTAPGNTGMTLTNASMAAENADLEGRMTSYLGD